MTLFETVTLAISAGQLLVAGIGVWLVRQGLHQMRRAGDQREKREDARHREAMAAIDSRHREAMRALDGQVEAFRSQGEALRSQGEALRSQGEALHSLVKGMDQQGEALHSQGETLGSLVKGLDRQGEALKVVIERTAPRQ